MLERLLEHLVSTLLKAVIIGIIAFETFGDDYGHYEKNKALESIQKEIDDGEYKDKEAILQALKTIEDYQNGMQIEEIHDLWGERENPREGFKDEKSGYLGFLDFFDFNPDYTIMDVSYSKDNGKKVTEDATIAINWGEVTPVNFVINYKQAMQGTLDFRRTVAHYVDPLFPLAKLDAKKMGKKGPITTENIRILLEYLYFNYYANDPDKIIIESKYDEQDGKIIINSVVKVYQDSFSNIPSPNKEVEESVQFGFDFKEDPRNSEEEYEKAYEETKYAWSLTGLNIDTKLLRYRTASKKANSFYASKDYYEEHRERFENYRNDILNANDANSIQASFAFYCAKFHMDTQANIEKILQENNVKKEVINNTEYQVYDCEFKDRDEEGNSVETVKDSEIDWPDNLEDIPKIMYKLPLILPKERYSKSTVMTATELDRIKRQEIDADTDLPKVKEGEESEEDVMIYTVFDWNEIKEEQQEQQQEDNGQASILNLASPDSNYTAESVPEINTVFIGSNTNRSSQNEGLEI